MPRELGPIWMPAPISLNAGACSQTTTWRPVIDRARAAARPPMPPPTMRMGSLLIWPCLFWNSSGIGRREVRRAGRQAFAHPVDDAALQQGVDLPGRQVVLERQAPTV